jgi:hypothetical protein
MITPEGDSRVVGHLPPETNGVFQPAAKNPLPLTRIASALLR